MSRDAYYFSHDSNARHDPKVSAMRTVYKAEGYGWYWMLLEMMRDANEYKLDLRSKYAYQAYAMQLQGDVETIKTFIQDCVHEFELFESDGESFWSPSFLRRMEVIDQKSKKSAESVNKRWEKVKSKQVESYLPTDTDEVHTKYEGNTNVIRSYNECNTDEIQTNYERNTKEIKRNEIKRKEIKDLKTSSDVFAASNSESIKSSEEQTEPFETDAHSELAQTDVTDTHVTATVESDPNDVEEPENEEAVFLTAVLISRMQRNNPKAKIPSNLSKWHKEMERILRIDGYDLRKVQDTINWCQDDSFWRANILSPSKLREKMPTLILQMNRNGPATKKSSFTVIQELYQQAIEEEAAYGQEGRAETNSNLWS